MNKLRRNIYTGLDEVMDAGWRAFVDVKRKEIAHSNERLFRVLKKQCGSEYCIAIRRIHNEFATHSLITIARQPHGFHTKYQHYSFPNGIWLEQSSSPEGMQVQIFIEIRKDRWIRIAYTTK